MEFEKRHQVQYFSGEWVEEGQERAGIGLAMRVLWDAVLRCPNEDMTRCTNTADALDYLKTKLGRAGCIGDFRNVLKLADPAQRFNEARRVYMTIGKRLPRGIGKGS